MHISAGDLGSETVGRAISVHGLLLPLGILPVGADATPEHRITGTLTGIVSDTGDTRQLAVRLDLGGRFVEVLVEKSSIVAIQYAPHEEAHA